MVWISVMTKPNQKAAREQMPQRGEERRVVLAINYMDTELVFIGYRDFTGGKAPMYSTDNRRTTRREEDRMGQGDL